MINMKILALLTPLSIYHGCSTWRTFWEGKFTVEEKFSLGEFTAVNMKNFGRHNFRKHREIKGSDKYVALDILLKFDILEKIKITSSESKDNLERSGKGLITYMGFKSKSRPK